MNIKAVRIERKTNALAELQTIILRRPSYVEFTKAIELLLEKYFPRAGDLLREDFISLAVLLDQVYFADLALTLSVLEYRTESEQVYSQMRKVKKEV